MLGEPKEERTIGSFNEKTKTIKLKTMNTEQQNIPEQDELGNALSFEETGISETQFDTLDLGQFEFATLTKEGDSIDLIIREDLELLDRENRMPPWVPQKIETKCYIGERYPSGMRVIISKFYRLEQAVKQKGMNAGVYRVTRGKKSGEEQNAFVEFDVKYAPLPEKK